MHPLRPGRQVRAFRLDASEGAGVQHYRTAGPARPDVARVLIVDDHRIFADLLAYSLDSEDDFTCVGRATTVAQAIALTDSLEPDIVVMDIGLPDGDGVEATSRITQRHPGVRVLILTGNVDQNFLARAAQAGAVAFLAKYGGLDEVLATLRGARTGAVVINSTMLSLLTAPSTRENPSGGAVPALTAREQDVLRLLAEGRDIPRIARTLSITITTCRGQVKNLREKLGARTQLEVVLTAHRAGLLREAFDGPGVPGPRHATHAGSAAHSDSSR